MIMRRHLLLLALPCLLLTACSDENDDGHCKWDTCAPHGTCIEGTEGPYCNCDDGYIQDDGLVCIADDVVDIGKPCAEDSDCPDGYCLKFTGDNEGYCTTTNCVTDEDCGPGRCCVEVAAAYFVCLEIAEGYACGDGRGTCGATCTGTLDSACAIDNPCLRWENLDPEAICSKPCESAADCRGCEWEKGPEVAFDCVTLSGGDKYCLFERPSTCESSETCDGDEICAIGVSADPTNLFGECAAYGALPPGSACNDEDEPSALSFEERCSGFYCLGGKCTEVCRDDEDCPEGMSCLEFSFEQVNDTITVCQGT